MADRLVTLRAPAVAYIAAAELIVHCCQTREGLIDGVGMIPRLPETLDLDRQADHAIDPG